jgi:hypothetical protein
LRSEFGADFRTLSNGGPQHYMSILLALTISRSVAEAKAFMASGDYYKFFDFAHVPMKFDFPESN